MILCCALRTSRLNTLSTYQKEASNGYQEKKEDSSQDEARHQAGEIVREKSAETRQAQGRKEEVEKEEEIDTAQAVFFSKGCGVKPAAFFFFPGKGLKSFFSN